MPPSANISNVAPRAQGVLVCRIRSRLLRGGPSAIAGEFELEHNSQSIVEIPVDRSPLQYLDLIVTNATGEIVSSSYYGDQFSPLAETFVLELRPGDRFVAPVSLLGT